MKLISGMIFKDKKNGLRKTIIDVSGEQIYIKDHEGIRFMMSGFDLENFNEFTGELDQELVPIGTKLYWMDVTIPCTKIGHSKVDTGLKVYIVSEYDGKTITSRSRPEELGLFPEEEDANS